MMYCNFNLIIVIHYKSDFIYVFLAAMSNYKIFICPEALFHI